MKAPALSICMVTYQACSYLRDCLESIDKYPPSLAYEIIVVDNGSDDGTLAMLRQQFPQVQIIQNSTNLGFTRPSNQAMQVARGNYLLLLNPDTLLHSAALDRLIGFMQESPQVGICGPKVLNPDGSLQMPCRRGESRPWAVISYFSGLWRLWPRSRFLGGYLLNYLPEDETTEVAGVSGSCMLIRRQLIEQIGYMDEQFFAYQEDADYCFQARRAGWKVIYYPQAQVTHFGGRGGSAVQPWRSVVEWHLSYWRYYRKNLAEDYFFLFNWAYYMAMLAKLLVALLLRALRLPWRRNG